MNIIFTRWNIRPYMNDYGHKVCELCFRQTIKVYVYVNDFIDKENNFDIS